MLGDFNIEASRGHYAVNFIPDERHFFQSLSKWDNAIFIIDDKVLANHRQLVSYLKANTCKVISLEPAETEKEFSEITKYLSRLEALKCSKSTVLVGIGGGITQDVVSFCASIFYRGISWVFYPSTLLAQADSCIGSKTSINLGDKKNLIGNFYPPVEVFIYNKLIETLDDIEIYSGIGEIFKAHAIDSLSRFSALGSKYSALEGKGRALEIAVYDSLKIKKKYIELDEFDRNERKVFNYGHSFGHAIESASCFEIPHGIAVTLGMFISNKLSVHFGLLGPNLEGQLNETLSQNFHGFQKKEWSFDAFKEALAKDKKNTPTHFGLIFPVEEIDTVRLELVPQCVEFWSACKVAIEDMRSV